MQLAVVRPPASVAKVHLQLAIWAATHSGYCHTSWPKRWSQFSHPGGDGAGGDGPALHVQPVLGSVGSSSSHVVLRAEQLPEHVVLPPTMTAWQAART